MVEVSFGTATKKKIYKNNYFIRLHSIIIQQQQQRQETDELTQAKKIVSPIHGIMNETYSVHACVCACVSVTVQRRRQREKYKEVRRIFNNVKAKAKSKRGRKEEAPIIRSLFLSTYFILFIIRVHVRFLGITFFGHFLDNCFVPKLK